MSSGTGILLKMLLKNFDVLVGPLICFVHPLYASIKAMETGSSSSAQQWLTYWFLYSLINLFEHTFAKVITWIPIRAYAKLILTCWLVIPYFSGAMYVYKHWLSPLLANPQTLNIWYVPRKKEIFGDPDDVLTAAEKYIEEYGTEEFMKLINRDGHNFQEATTSYMNYAEDYLFRNECKSTSDYTFP